MLYRFFAAAFLLCLLAAPAPSEAAGWSSSNAPMYSAFNRGHTLTGLWRKLDNR